MTTVRFHDHAETALLARAGRQEGARRAAELEIALAEDGPALGDQPATHREEVARVEVQLASFADVTALAPGAITRFHPAPHARDAEPSRLALVELADPALPWLYAPAPPAGGPRRPWLVVVVGQADAGELALDADGRAVTLHPPLLARMPPLAHSHTWAHAQTLEGELTGRLLCPIVLEPATDYVAVVVPAFRLGTTGTPEDAWPVGGTEPVRLPALASWRFRTGEADDFLALALALEPRPAPPGLGRLPVRYPRRPLERRLLAGGALVAIDPPATDPDPTPADPWPPVRALPAAVADDLDRLRHGAARDHRGRPILALPVHGGPWSARAELAWSREVNGDPRLRGAAGVGVELATRAQDELIDLTVRHLGPIREAEQRIRNLALGLGVARSLWQRRLPADAAARVFLLGPAMARIATEQGPLLGVVAGADRALAPSLFSAAAQRFFRRGPARTALARPDLRAADAVPVANRCPEPPPDPAGLPTVRPAPLDPARPLDPHAVAAIADGTALAGAVSARDRGTGGSSSSGDWSSASPPAVLRVAYSEQPGPTVPFPRSFAAVVEVRLLAVSNADSDRVVVQAAVRPSAPALPAPWRLEVVVAGRSATFGAGGGLIALPRPQGDRAPVAHLTLIAVDRPEMTQAAAVPVALAPFALAIDARPLAWRAGAVEAELTCRIANLSDRSASPIGVLELGGAGASAGLPALAGFEVASVTATRALATEAGDERALVRLRAGGQVTGTVTLARGTAAPITLAGTPWLAPYLVAAASATGGTPDAEAHGSAMAPWVEAVASSGLEEASLDGTPFVGVEAADIARLVDRLAASGTPAPAQRPCRPVDIDRLSSVLVAAFDPTGDRPRALERVAGTISGRPADAGSEPIGPCVELPVPVWELLRQHRADWLLPGLADLAPGAVVALTTNPTFVEALLVGINQALLAELAWRGLPVPPGCTLLRRFWGRVDIDSGEPQPDIAPIARWGDTPLADATHAASGAGSPLVLLFRTELFRRYPSTLLYLLPAGDPAVPEFTRPEAHGDLTRVYPEFQGTIGGDVTFAGFPSVSPAEARGYWVVLEEPAGGMRFWGRKPLGDGAVQPVLVEALARAAGGAELAAMTVADPIRIMIPGPRILPDGGTR